MDAAMEAAREVCAKLGEDDVAVVDAIIRKHCPQPTRVPVAMTHCEGGHYILYSDNTLWRCGGIRGGEYLWEQVNAPCQR